jgi:hypothetical protein
MFDAPCNPTEAKRWLRLFARQLRQYVKGTADELTPFIEPYLANYVRGAILKALRGQDLEKSFRLAQPRGGAPTKRNQIKDPKAFSKQQDLIFQVQLLRAKGILWKEIPTRIGYRGAWKALEKMCREQADPVEQMRRRFANRAARRVHR